MRTVSTVGLVVILTVSSGTLGEVLISKLPSDETLGKLQWLRTQGTRIVDDRGKTIILRGINLGGWLVEEMWMMPFETKPPAASEFPAIRDHVTLWETIEKRFGKAGEERIRTALRNSWLNEADFDHIRAAGFNCVRLPFLYDLLDEPDGLNWLDRAIDWAGKRSIYVILDLHGAPGRQSNDHHTGEAERNQFFYDPAMVESAETVWTRIAIRYRDRPEVAAYDLLNEPMGAPNTSTLYLVQNRLYQAIRSVDQRHIIIIEDGYTDVEDIPYPAVSGWDNVVLSSHAYLFEAKSEQDYLNALQWYVPMIEKTQNERQVPLYLGEFNLEPNGTPKTMATVLKTMNEKVWSWSVWCYKVVEKGGTSSMWGLYRNTQPVMPLDPFCDSEAELVRKMEQIRTERLDKYEELLQVYQAAGMH